MESTCQAPVEDAEQNKDRCPICLEDKEPFDLQTSVRCSVCSVPYCASCLNRYLDMKRHQIGNLSAEKCCHCMKPFPVVRPFFTSRRHFVRVFENLDNRLLTDMFFAFKRSFRGMALRSEACLDLGDRLHVLQDTKAALQPRMSTRLTENFNERYVQSVDPTMRASDAVISSAQRHVQKMCADVVMQTARHKAKNMLDMENAFRERRIERMVKPLGLELRRKFLASRVYTKFVKAQAEKFKDRFDDLRKQSDLEERTNVRAALMLMMTKFTKGPEKKKISRELHSQVHARLCDDEVIQDCLENYVFYFNYEDDRDDNKIMWHRFVNDVGDSIQAYRLEGRM